jgi:type 1 glutamine amidotransferase
MGRDAGIDVVCSKDGRVFDKDIEQYDGFAFYCNGDLTKPNEQGEPPMTQDGKMRFLKAVAAGKGFVGFHSTCACWQLPEPKDGKPAKLDPFLAMLGGEFVSHGPQQEAALLLTSRKLPGIRALGIGEGIAFYDEWYSLKNFARDLHVILVQETRYLKGDCYRRPPFPCTWTRQHDKGRVFFTSMGHREDIWTNPFFQAIVGAGLVWALGDVDVDLPGNIDQVTPHADQLTGKKNP